MAKEKKHILMIDDDPMIQRMFGAKLSAAGFEMLYAHGGEEGRETARHLKPDLILMDIRMPDTDGITLAGRMKQEDMTKDIPIVLLSNEDLPPEAEKWVKDGGIAAYFHKSVDLNQFVEEVKNILR